MKGKAVVAMICAATVAFVTTVGSAYAEKPRAVGGTVTIPVYLLDAGGKPLPTEAIPTDLVLQLGTIGGSLGGLASTPFQTVHIGHDKKFQLDLAYLSARLGNRATQFRETDAAPLELTPEETKFARVSVGVSSDAPEAPNKLAVTFWDMRPNGSLTLLYCDLPCRLRALSTLKSTDDFDFDALSAGLVWMLTKKDRHLHFAHTRAVKARPAIVICPVEAIDKIADNLAR